MSDDLKHECGVAMVVLRNPQGNHSGDFGVTKLSLLMEKQHNRGQDGAGAAILAANPEPGALPYWIAKSTSETPLADVLAALARRHVPRERIFLGHLRYATYGKGDEAFCHPFVHEASELEHTLLLAGNFNLTNTAELFEAYRRQGEFPTSRSDGYLICEMIAQGLARNQEQASTCRNLLAGLRSALANADGAWTLCGMTGDGWAFATRDPNGIRPGWYYTSEEVVAVASERPAIQAAFDVPPEAVRELPPGQALLVSPDGEVEMAELCSTNSQRPCAFERIYFSRANDADIHRERKALGAALLPQILMSAQADLSDIFFSYIPNSAQVAFHGLLQELYGEILTQRRREAEGEISASLRLCVKKLPRFGQIAVKDAKFRTFIADAASREEFYKHVYDVTYGLVRPGQDTLVVLDDSIVRGNTMRNAILPMLDRLEPKRIVIASSAPPIRYPDCYGIDMSTLGELVAFRALINLLGGRDALARALARESASLPELYARFTDEEHCDEIARLLTPPGMKAEVKVVFQTVENMRRCLQTSTVSDGGPTAIGDWYFTGDYPTPGGYKVLAKALENYLDRKTDRSY
ncbi:MAG: amidophosphoribosyltransferase [Kiritimatiellae bacterium]|nr:amidophosphoribosyltransferase [Kiritimatiellia bacterium]